MRAYAATAIVASFYLSASGPRKPAVLRAYGLVGDVWAVTSHGLSRIIQIDHLDPVGHVIPMTPIIPRRQPFGLRRMGCFGCLVLGIPISTRKSGQSESPVTSVRPLGRMD
jgi:hypothetical protein